MRKGSREAIQQKKAMEQKKLEHVVRRWFYGKIQNTKTDSRACQICIVYYPGKKLKRLKIIL